MDLQELLDEHSISYRIDGHEHCRPGWLQVDCPYCSKDWQHFRLGFNLSSHYFHCWACGSVRTWDTLKELGLPLSECYALIRQAGDAKARESPSERRQLVLPAGLCDLMRVHKDYLRRRGLNPDKVTKLWGLKGIGMASKLPWRIWMPVTYRSEVVSWTTRSISDQVKFRYLSAPPEEEKLPAKSLLYGEDLAGHAVLVTEGPFDVYALGPGAVATLGTSYSKAQVAKIAKFPSRAIIFDNEVAAQQRAKKLVSDLEVYPGKTYHVVIDAKDPGSASRKEIQTLRRSFLQ